LDLQKRRYQLKFSIHGEQAEVAFENLVDRSRTHR